MKDKNKQPLKKVQMTPPTDDEEMCRQVAKVIGPSSAAAAALKDLDERRSKGLFAWLYYNGATWLVGSGSIPQGVEQEEAK